MINLFVWLFLAVLLCRQHFVCITTPRQSVMVITRRRNLEKVGSYRLFVWEWMAILFFARSGSLMELYGPDVIVLLMNLWVFNGVVKWSCMVLNGMVWIPLESSCIEWAWGIEWGWEGGDDFLDVFWNFDFWYFEWFFSFVDELVGFQRCC